MKLIDIQRQPTTLENNHESLYRSYHILEQVLKMVERGDSKESIFELVELLNHHQISTGFTKAGNL